MSNERIQLRQQSTKNVLYGLVYMLLELRSVSISSSSNKVLDTAVSAVFILSLASDPLNCLLAAVSGVSNTMSEQAVCHFLCLDTHRDRSSFPGCLSTQTRRRSGTQLVNEDRRLSRFRHSCAPTSSSSSRLSWLLASRCSRRRAEVFVLEHRWLRPLSTLTSSWLLLLGRESEQSTSSSSNKSNSILA
jgi:hypothetical protein